MFLFLFVLLYLWRKSSPAASWLAWPPAPRPTYQTTLVLPGGGVTFAVADALLPPLVEADGELFEPPQALRTSTGTAAKVMRRNPLLPIGLPSLSLATLVASDAIGSWERCCVPFVPHLRHYPLLSSSLSATLHSTALLPVRLPGRHGVRRGPWRRLLGAVR